MVEQLKIAAAVVAYFSTIAGVFTYLGKIWKGLKAEKNGVMCLLRASICSIYYEHCDEEEPTLREYERKNLDELYAGYHTLHGNTFVDDIYDKMRHWRVVT